LTDHLSLVKKPLDLGIDGAVVLARR